MSKEAMKLALEALQNSWTDPCTEQYDLEVKAIKALEEALAKQKQGEPVACSMCNEWEKVCDQHLRYINKLKKKRTWVGLTDDETETLIHRFDGDPHTLLDEVNARLKKRNT
jgi:hypothetical protein